MREIWGNWMLLLRREIQWHTFWIVKCNSFDTVFEKPAAC